MPFTPRAGRASAGTALADRPVLYLNWRVERALGQELPGSSSLADDVNLAHAGLRGEPAHAGVQRSAAARSGGARILLLGLAWLKNTGDARESSAVRVAQLLGTMGADLRAADPHVVEGTAVDGLVTRVELTPGELADADAVLLLTDHDACDYDLVVQHASFVFDCRRKVSGANVETL